jgi:predicted DNA-binding transcriptional regulator AlpA
MRGGKGVPETVTEHPMVFLTLTAPSFGPVHSRRERDGKVQRCRPRRNGEACAHGVSLACSAIHDEDDPRLGEPLCAECFDYEHAVLWNALAPELWRRTAIQLPRELARLRGTSVNRLPVRVSYVKVAEFQHRGALHFHCVLRLDAKDSEVERPAPEFGCELLVDAVLAAVRHVSVSSPLPNGPTLRWGAQVEVRELDAETSGSTAGYIAKYATKSTEAVGGLLYRLEGDDLDRLKVRPHVRRFVECAWNLATRAARAAPASVGAPARVPRPLLHQEPALLDDVHRAAHGAARAPAPASRRAGHPAARELGVLRLGLSDGGRCLARRVRTRPRRQAAARGPRRVENKRRETKMSEGERYITAKEVGARVGLSPETILRYYREGRIPGRRLPGSVRPVRFLWSEVEAVWDCERQLTLGDAA